MKRTFTAILLLCFVLLTGCKGIRTQKPNTKAADLVIYTYQEESIYSPILKEYQERTGLNVQVITGTYEELQEQIQKGTLSKTCDIVFGADGALLESAPECWEPYIIPESSVINPFFSSASGRWTVFSARPLVIIYNTRIVTYRELPTGWNSLLEPRWKGRIAFMEPTMSDTYACALAAAMQTAGTSENYIAELAENINYITFDSLAALDQAMVDGRSFVGVTAEEKAISLIADGADIDYIYPQEGICILIDGTAVVSDCRNPDQAKAFIDFTVSKDVQYFLTAAIYRRPVRTDLLTPPGLTPLSGHLYTSISLPEGHEAVIKIWNETFDSLSEERR